ncbi:Permease of the drug/metabolite transporter (DMT) superfamily [Hyphomicrobiales bacterium]|nr:Permease of the drug/metabolite transporter (DMT) superfamily [Hyphomicrobiales bacterium]CAH1698476.1 Permease of the drug/metabolite transporter (DMT) superfamily [Hyphomicrobiales bacterium]CAI0342125.1 Permease of the drug/metabolite transporter (DMT) superfamily [Hyphomicrobiales bacterium]
MATTAPEASPPQEPSRSFIAVNLLTCSLLWGSSYLFIKLMSGQVPALAIAAGRGLLGAAALALWSLWRRQNPLPHRAEIVPWIVLGTTNGWLPNVLVAYALTQLASGPAAMIQAASPLVTALGAHFFFAEERLGRRRLSGILLGMAGVALLIGPHLFEGGGTALSVLAMAGVALSYTTANLYVRSVPAATGEPARLALGQQMFSGTIATALTLAVLGPSAFLPVADHLPAMLALGVLATAIPVTVFMRLIRAAGPTRAAMTGYLVPTVAVILGVVVLHENLELRQILGGCIILTGVFLVTTAPRRVGAS